MPLFTIYIHEKHEMWAVNSKSGAELQSLIQQNVFA